MKKELEVIEFEIPLHLEGEGKFVWKGNEWDNSTMFTAVKDCKPFDLPLAVIDASYMPWTLSSFRWLLYHIKRIEKASMEYPVILTPDGVVCDGWHRIAKAILNGDTTIKAVKLSIMPEPDRTTTE